MSESNDNRLMRLQDAVNAFLGFWNRGKGQMVMDRLQLAKHKEAADGLRYHIDALHRAMSRDPRQ